MPTKVLRYQGRTFTGTQEQFCTDALPASISDLYEYQHELNPGLPGEGALP